MPRLKSGSNRPRPHTSGSRKDDLIRDLENQLEMNRLVFNHIHNGVVVTDPDGYILMFNEPYGRFLGVDPREQIGKHVREVVENTRMPEVAESGEPEFYKTHRIMGQDMVVQRIPIRKNGKVIAVYGQVMFKDIRDMGHLVHELALLESKVKLYEEELTSLRSTRYTIDSIKGVGPAVKALKKAALKAAQVNLPMLITGESGTGKELFAQAIHHHSPRRTQAFVRINCAAIPKDLLESELFGYEKGAFTGAQSKGKPGKIELADKGTVFLDEIGDLPLEMQPKLLRVLEEKEIERIGGTTVKKVDFRLIAATNQNLDQLISSRQFRKDLFYRLNVIPLAIPPLRERREDIIPLAEHLLDQISGQTLGPDLCLAPEAENILIGHDWPGNVRELYNVLEHASVNAEGNVIDRSHLPLYLTGHPKSGQKTGQARTLKEITVQAEIDALRQALAQNKNNKARAAGALGIHRTLLYKKLKKYKIST